MGSRGRAAGKHSRAKRESGISSRKADEPQNHRVPRRDTLPSFVVAPESLADAGALSGLALRESVMLPPAPQSVPDRHFDFDSNQNQQSQQQRFTSEIIEPASVASAEMDAETLQIMRRASAVVRERLIAKAREMDCDLEKTEDRKQREFVRRWNEKLPGRALSQAKVSQIVNFNPNDPNAKPIDLGMSTLVKLSALLTVTLDDIVIIDEPSSVRAQMASLQKQLTQLSEHVATAVLAPPAESHERPTRTPKRGRK